MAENNITFKRDENGVLKAYDADTGKELGEINEHGNDTVDEIEEV